MGPAEEPVERDRAVALPGGHEARVLGKAVEGGHRPAIDGDVELARKVGKQPVVQEHGGQPAAKRPDVDQLCGIEPCPGMGHDVADVVVAGLP